MQETSTRQLPAPPSSFLTDPNYVAAQMEISKILEPENVTEVKKPRKKRLVELLKEHLCQPIVYVLHTYEKKKKKKKHQIPFTLSLGKKFCFLSYEEY